MHSQTDKQKSERAQHLSALSFVIYYSTVSILMHNAKPEHQSLTALFVIRMVNLVEVSCSLNVVS